MKKLILSLAVAGAVSIAVSACNSTKNVSEDSDTTMMDTTMTPVDTTSTMDTTMTMPPDTTVQPM